MTETWQSLERGYDILYISEEVVGDIKFVEFVERGEVDGETLQTIAVKGETL